MTDDQRLVGGEGTKSPTLKPWGDTNSDLVKSQAPPAIEAHKLKVLGSVLKQVRFQIRNDGGIKFLASAVSTPDHFQFNPARVGCFNIN